MSNYWNSNFPKVIRYFQIQSKYQYSVWARHRQHSALETNYDSTYTCSWIAHIKDRCTFWEAAWMLCRICCFLPTCLKVELLGSISHSRSLRSEESGRSTTVPFYLRLPVCMQNYLFQCFDARSHYLIPGLLQFPSIKINFPHLETSLLF